MGNAITTIRLLQCNTVNFLTFVLWSTRSCIQTHFGILYHIYECVEKSQTHRERMTIYQRYLHLASSFSVFLSALVLRMIESTHVQNVSSNDNYCLLKNFPNPLCDSKVWAVKMIVEWDWKRVPTTRAIITNLIKLHLNFKLLWIAVRCAVCPVPPLWGLFRFKSEYSFSPSFSLSLPLSLSPFLIKHWTFFALSLWLFSVLGTFSKCSVEQIISFI